MKTLQEKIEVMQAAEAGLLVEVSKLYGHVEGNWDWIDKRTDDIRWDWGSFDYRIKQHQYKVGDFVEIVKSHVSGRAGTVVEITEIDYLGDIWHKEWIILDPNDGNITKIKLAEKPYKPFTAETFPKGMLWIRNKGSNESRGLITSDTTRNVKTPRTIINFYEMVDNYEISIDGGETWQVAGILNNDS